MPIVKATPNGELKKYDKVIGAAKSGIKAKINAIKSKERDIPTVLKGTYFILISAFTRR